MDNKKYFWKLKQTENILNLRFSFINNNFKNKYYQMMEMILFLNK